jgi:hypothetical protein
MARLVARYRGATGGAMTMTLDILEPNLFKGLRAWLMNITGYDGDHVVKELSNRVAMPKGNFINMWGLFKMGLSTPVETYNGAGSLAVQRPLRYTMQVDCYGTDSSNIASLLAVVFRTSQSVLFFQNYSMTPLWVDEPKKMTFINGEEQYEERWVTVIHFQYNPSATAVQDYVTSTEVALIDADRVYPI